ncbi:AraC family transcriptional regulator [Olivibacter jilunii]|uniref:AraC family transcriptional regulator n=1 Tax=Olivibacter jilunii TaxID=985016 RepID=UPI003F18F3BA
MNAQQIIIPKKATSSLNVRRVMTPNLNDRWHCHEELELVCFHKGTGTLFIGDHIRTFLAGDLVLIGSNLPHHWRYDHSIRLLSDNTPFTTTLHFRRDFLGQTWLNLPEAKAIKSLLLKAERGVLISGLETKTLFGNVERICDADGFRKILDLLDCLRKMTECKGLNTLSSRGFQYTGNKVETDRLNNIYHYILTNFQENLNLEKVAQVADLAPSSFCRYFKVTTGKTYSRFLQDVRIGYACKLLLSDQLSVKQVCYSSGFRNYTSFHEAFKAATGMTPKAYLEKHQVMDV